MSPLNPWFGLVAASLAAGRGAFDMMAQLVEAPMSGTARAADHPRAWASPHVVRRDLTTMRVLDFSVGNAGTTAILVAPFALHAATTSDFAPSHSVVESLIRHGVTRLVLTDWRSAGASERFLSIDSYLADLNVLVDDVGAPAALVGLCQGGWLAAAYAARFPAKVSRLALDGAPIDIEAAPSAIAEIIRLTSSETIGELVALGDGLLLGRMLMAMWPVAHPSAADIDAILQREGRKPGPQMAALRQRFLEWNDDLVDLPGVFYRQTSEWIFRENRLAKGLFVALGDRIDLRRIACPLYLLSAGQDEIVASAQLMALAGLVSTPERQVTSRCVPGRHLSLFMGQRTLKHEWPAIAAFLSGRGIG
ncbi:MAG: alpha/beta fold hydrolase [Hyphomicrobiales bacterium]|nr:alpha/beta fold hydrolase [Hyphomicrobiales bacterium]